jgi:hypothetical protein
MNKEDAEIFSCRTLSLQGSHETYTYLDVLRHIESVTLNLKVKFPLLPLNMFRTNILFLKLVRQIAPRCYGQVVWLGGSLYHDLAGQLCWELTSLLHHRRIQATAGESYATHREPKKGTGGQGNAACAYYEI